MTSRIQIDPEAVIAVLRRRAQNDPVLALQIENAILQVALESKSEEETVLEREVEA